MHETIARIGGSVSVAGRIAGLAVVLAVTGFGCAARGEGSPFVSVENSRINIEIINHGFEDVTLHAVWPGQRVRLGFVTGTRTVNFMLPWTRSELLQIEIDLLAGPECITQPIWADPGDIILVEITNQIMRDPDCLPMQGRDS
jgi:hypothetical protein